MKRMIALLLVFLFSIESFAAIVSDNDGAAFITKSEFDSLKNDFQAQIDNYNTSLDSKIDGAIAAYLAGIKLTKKVQSKIVTPSWKTVDFLNDIVKPEFAYPNLRLNNAFSMYAWDGDVASEGDSAQKFNQKLVSYILTSVYNKTWGKTETNLRPLVSVTGDEANHKKYIWNGIANRYVETIVTTTTGYAPVKDFAYMDAGTNNFRFYVNDLAYINPVGYNKDFLTIKDLWKGSFKYQYRGSTSTNTWSNGDVEVNDNNKTSSNVTQVGLEKVEDELKQCEHIIQYKAETEWPISNETFLKTLNRCDLNTKKNNNYATSLTKSNYGRFFAGVRYRATATPAIKKGSLGIEYNNTNTDIVPSVGYIGKQPSSSIFQWNDKIDVDLTGTTWKLEDISLEKGLPLHGIKKQYDLEWECSFNGVTWTNASNQLTTDDKREVDLYFSYGPFKDKFETDNPAYVAKDENGKDVNYITTSKRKKKITITGTKDDVIYVKCIPHFESSESALKDKFWQVQLNIDNSGVIYYTDNN